MSRPIFLIIITCLVIIPNFSSASIDWENDDEAKLALEGQELIFERRYDDALKLFQDFEKKYPDSPLGPFGRMVVYEVQMLEREDFSLQKEFLEAAKRGEKKVDKIMQFYRPAPKDIFYSGALIGLNGFFNARKGNWWKAYLKGNKSRQIFNSIIKKEPLFIDSMFGVGMYIYWRSVFTNRLKFLPFFSDKRQEGINIVKMVAKSGYLARELAKVNLGIIYLEEKHYDDALNVFKEYSKKYPKNVMLHILSGKTLLAAKRYSESIGKFKKVMELDASLYKPRYFMGMAAALGSDKGKFGEGERDLIIFLEKSDDNIWKSYAYYWLGMIMEKRKDNKSARDYYKKAYELNRELKRAKIRVSALGGGI